MRMLKTAPQKTPSSFTIEKRELVKLKLKAIRSGAWFKALEKIDRALVDLTIKVASNIHSHTLANRLLSVMKKLEGVICNKLHRALREVGFSLAHKISSLAQKWNNILAKNWAFDLNFAKFLAVMHINDSRFKP